MLSRVATNRNIPWNMTWGIYMACWIWKYVSQNCWLQISTDVNINLKIPQKGSFRYWLCSEWTWWLETSCWFTSVSVLYENHIWDKVFKNGPSKICGRQPWKNLKGVWSAWQPLKNLKEYGLPKADYTPFKFFQGCLPQILLGPFLNTLSIFGKIFKINNIQ